MISEKKKMLVKLAAYYEKVLTDEQILIYSEQLEENLTDEQCSVACKIYINNAANEYFPRPIAKLIELIKKPIKIEDESVFISARIIEAISKFGWNNYEQAMFYIGSKGVEVVKKFGGWQYLCQELGQSIQLTTFNAQCREILKSTGKIETASEQLPQLENVTKNLIDFKIKEIEK